MLPPELRGGDQPLPPYKRELDIMPGMWVQLFTPEQIHAGFAHHGAHPIDLLPGQALHYCETTLNVSNGRKLKVELNYHDPLDSRDLSPRIAPYEESRYQPIVGQDESGMVWVESAPFVVKIIAEDEGELEFSQVIYSLDLPEIGITEGYLSTHEGDTIIEDFPEDELGGMLTAEILIPNELDLFTGIKAAFSFPNQENNLN